MCELTIMENPYNYDHDTFETQADLIRDVYGYLNPKGTQRI